MKLIVTAGGQGKKIWPLSREAKPKQFQAIVGKTPPYKDSVDALLKAYKAEDIYISTKKRYLKIASDLTPQIPKENFLLEPDAAKDRGPGEGFAFVHMSMKHPDEPFMIIQSDVLRVPEEGFIKMVLAAEKIEIRDRKYMTGGMKATYPILGNDFLRLGKQIDSEDGVEIFKTDEFVPRSDDYQKTKELIKSFFIAIHCNHGCWYPDMMLDAYKQYRPDWYDSLMKIRDVLTKGASDGEIDAIYEQMEKGATEAVTKNLLSDSYTILLPFRWTDIGTWDSVYEFFDPEGKVHTDGNVLEVESKQSLVKCTNDEKIVALIGVNNLVVVDTDDALLVCDKSRTEEVKDVVEMLKNRKITKFI